MNEFITSQYDESRESFYDFYMRVGIHYFGKSEPEKTYWLVGYSFGSTESQLQRFLSDGVWESRHDDGNANDQKMIPLAQSISEGDILILKSTSTKGSKHDQPFMRIKAVGVVTSNITTYKIDSFTTCQCSVRYVSNEEKDFFLHYRLLIVLMYQYKCQMINLYDPFEFCLFYQSFLLHCPLRDN